MGGNLRWLAPRHESAFLRSRPNPCSCLPILSNVHRASMVTRFIEQPQTTHDPCQQIPQDALPCSRLALSATDFTPLPAAGASAITRFLSAPAQRQQGHAIRAEARSALGNDAPDATPHEAAAPGAILAANSRSPGGSGGGAEARAPSTAGAHSSEGPVGSEEDPLLAGVDVRQQAALLREAAMLRTLRNAPCDSSRGAAGKSGKRKADSQHSITRFFGQGS